MARTTLEILPKEEIEQIHVASLEILSSSGVKIDDPSVREMLKQFTNDDFADYPLPYDQTGTLANIIGNKDAKGACGLFFICKWCYRTMDFLISTRIR
jgi:hypothetical protein